MGTESYGERIRVRMSEIEGKRNRPRWPRFSGNRKLRRKNQRKECQKWKVRETGPGGQNSVGTEGYGERIREKNVRNRR